MSHAKFSKPDSSTELQTRLAAIVDQAGLRSAIECAPSTGVTREQDSAPQENKIDPPPKVDSVFEQNKPDRDRVAHTKRITRQTARRALIATCAFVPVYGVVVPQVANKLAKAEIPRAERLRMAVDDLNKLAEKQGIFLDAGKNEPWIKLVTLKGQGSATASGVERIQKQIHLRRVSRNKPVNIQKEIPHTAAATRVGTEAVTADTDIFQHYALVRHNGRLTLRANLKPSAINLQSLNTKTVSVKNDAWLSHAAMKVAPQKGYWHMPPQSGSAHGETWIEDWADTKLTNECGQASGLPNAVFNALQNAATNHKETLTAGIGKTNPEKAELLKRLPLEIYFKRRGYGAKNVPEFPFTSIPASTKLAAILNSNRSKLLNTVYPSKFDGDCTVVTNKETKG